MSNKFNDNQCWKSIGVYGDSSCEELKQYIHCRHCPVYSKAGRQLLDRPAEKELIDDWTRIIATPKTESQNDLSSFVVFRLSNEWLALSAELFIEAVNIRTVHSVPLRSNEIFRGITNINGELLLCFSCENLLSIPQINMEQQKHKLPRMVVVAQNDYRYVFYVDEMQGIAKISNSDIRPVPATISKSTNSFSSGLFSFKNHDTVIIDDNRFFDSIKRSLSW